MIGPASVVLLATCKSTDIAHLPDIFGEAVCISSKGAIDTAAVSQSRLLADSLSEIAFHCMCSDLSVQLIALLPT